MDAQLILMMKIEASIVREIWRRKPRGENERKMIKDRFILMIFCCQNHIPLRDKNINVPGYQLIRALISHIVLDIQSNVSGRKAT